MTEQHRSKMQKRVLRISLAILGIAVVFLIICGIKGLADTLIMPIGIGVIMLVYWVVSDVLSVIWVREFDGKTAKQKQSYYIFAAMDLAALGGLVYFLLNMESMAGVLLYVLFNMTKKKYKDEFLGIEAEKNGKPVLNDQQVSETENSEECDEVQ